ncbi:MAG: hypothetical protein EHM58_18020 [Ignavibacteriae bacterium]|nr:MAG: hypothetical protein EHM58_18020 [Ignavibacteriota bacterium]
MKKVILLIVLLIITFILNSCGKDNTIVNPPSSTIPSVPVLSYPPIDTTGISIPFTFTWMKADHAEKYTLQVALENTFTSPIINETIFADTSKTVTGLDSNTQYYWRVKAENSSGSSQYSAVWGFITGVPIPYFFQMDQIQFSGNTIGHQQIYFKTTKRTKISVEFTGETDAGSSNFIVSILAMDDSSSLAGTTIYYSSNQDEYNNAHFIVSEDISAIDPLYLAFRVELSRPPTGNKFVTMKNIRVSEYY